MLWKSNTINCEVFQHFTVSPHTHFPTQIPFSSRSNSNDPCCHSLRPSTLSRFFVIFCCYFPPQLHCTSTDFLSYPPIYFPLIFSTSLLYSQALSICTLFFLPFMVHPFIHNLPAKFTLVPLSCTTSLLTCTRALKHACRHSHK